MNKNSCKESLSARLIENCSHGRSWDVAGPDANYLILGCLWPLEQPFLAQFVSELTYCD